MAAKMAAKMKNRSYTICLCTCIVEPCNKEFMAVDVCYNVIHDATSNELSNCAKLFDVIY